MELSSDFIYVVTFAASVGGSYMVMNYRTNSTESKIKIMFKKLDELSENAIIVNEKIKELEKDKETITYLAKAVNEIINKEKNFLTLERAESKFITRNEFNIQTSNYEKTQEKLDSELKSISSKMDKIYLLIASIVPNSQTSLKNST